jgi:glycine oxidase
MGKSVIVVGAGIIGCAVARELAVRGIACTVIDDRPVGGGATRASAGMLAPYVEAHAGGPLLDLAIRSLELYQHWVFEVRHESGVEIEFAMIGTLEVALTADRAAELRRNGRAYGGWLEPADVAHAYPYLRPTAGALSNEKHGYVDAPQLAAALARAAMRAGAMFERARVLAVTQESGRLRVTTTTAVHESSDVVLAAGAWTNAIEGVRTPPLRPVRGQLLQLEWRAGPLQSIIWGPDCYVVPRWDGSVLVGATVEEAGFDERTTEEGIRRLRDAAADLLPVTNDLRLIEARVGLRPATPDELPVIGPDPIVAGLFHASGHYRNGVLLAPITAKLIGDLIVEGTRDQVLDSFKPDRFTSLDG